MTRSKISAVIPTKNVASIIRPTLDSLAFCDEVVVVDMFSTDDTKAVCESYPNVVFLSGRTTSTATSTTGAEQAKGDWILRLDSDEVVSDELRQSILEVLSQPNPAHSHYDAFCHLYFFGMRLRHGFGDQWRTMIYKKGTASYPVKTEHDGLSCTGPAGRLAGYYDHFTNPTLSKWIEKVNYYTDRDVERATLQPPRAWWKLSWPWPGTSAVRTWARGN